MSNSTTITETLKCSACGSDFDRERKRGVKPKNCPTCTQRLANEAKETAAGEEKVQKLHCESCDKDWTRPAQRGKPPKRCDNCRGETFHLVGSGREGDPVRDARDEPHGSIPQPVSKSSHYTVARLLSQYTSVPVEERYKLSYIESELARGHREDSDQIALKRVWATLEGRLS